MKMHRWQVRRVAQVLCCLFTPFRSSLGQRAQAILKPILLRRTKYSTLEGKPLLELPAKHIEIVKLQFTPDERQVGNFCMLDFGDGLSDLGAGV